MELMINFILGLMSSIFIGLATNYIYDIIVIVVDIGVLWLPELNPYPFKPH